MLGCTVNDMTIEWWRRQELEAKMSVCQDAVHIHTALVDFLEWFKSLGTVEGVWSHGASFDIPQLEFVLRSTGRPIPWAYNAIRDTRTVHWIAQLSNWEKPKRKVLHTALADAISQARDIQSALARLNVRPF